jgi:TolB protein
VFCVVLLALLLTGCGKGSGTKIAFVSERDGNQEIYVMDVDGSTKANLSQSANRDDDPVWSPEGSRIAFTSRTPGSGQHDRICIVDTDGADRSCVTDPETTNRSPSWSADGNKIAFTSRRDDDWEVYVMNADGSNQTNLTNRQGWDSTPRWSPDGSMIAFKSSRHAGDALSPSPEGSYTIPHTEIWLMDNDGSDPRRLTANVSVEGHPDHTPVDEYPRWSPDGKRILFFSNRDGRRNLYFVDVDGSNLIQVTDKYDGPKCASWAPDASQIVFSSFERWNSYPERRPNYETYLVDVGSLEVINLTDSQDLDESCPAWSPDGGNIIFAARPNDPLLPAGSRTDYDIYVMDADGSSVTRLTDDPARDSEPMWSPQPDR